MAQRDIFRLRLQKLIPICNENDIYMFIVYMNEMLYPIYAAPLLYSPYPLYSPPLIILQHTVYTQHNNTI